jgi:hypothetical protein
MPTGHLQEKIRVRSIQSSGGSPPSTVDPANEHGVSHSFRFHERFRVFNLRGSEAFQIGPMVKTAQPRVKRRSRLRDFHVAVFAIVRDSASQCLSHLQLICA